MDEKLKSRSLSFWLLKEGFDASNAFTEKNQMVGPLEELTSLPSGAELFLQKPQPHPPWWREYFGISAPLSQSINGALLFIPLEERVFVVTFGNVIHNIEPHSYEPDFGLISTLNAVDSTSLRNTDAANPGSSKRQRTQSPIGADLTFFDFESDSNVLAKLAGFARPEYRDLFQQVAGADQLRFSTKASPKDLPDICSKLLNLYGSEDYKESFPDVRNIHVVKDRKLADSLDSKLSRAIIEKSDDLVMALPEITDPMQAVSYRFSTGGLGEVFQDLNADSFYKHLDAKSVSDELLKPHELLKCHVQLLDGDHQLVSQVSVKRCLVFDTELPGSNERFHLFNNLWYAVDPSYVAQLERNLAQCIPSQPSGFPDREAKDEDEGQYNKTLANVMRGFCLDTKNFAPKGSTQVEPCDVLLVTKENADFVHVKIGTSSSLLSHLFNQGLNSYDLLQENEARQKLRLLIDDENSYNQLEEHIKNRKIQVRFVIVTPKSTTGGVRNLPLFSQISLDRARKQFQKMGVAMWFEFVKDNKPLNASTKKVRRPRSKEKNQKV